MVKRALSSRKGKKTQIGKARKKAKMPVEKKKMEQKIILKNAKKPNARAKQKHAPKAKHAKTRQRARKSMAKKPTGVKMKARQKPMKAASAKAAKAPASAKVPSHAKAPAAHAKAAANAKAARIPTSQKEGRRPRCIVLAGFGLNAEAELAHAFSLAGADASIVHFSDISSGKRKLSDYEIFAIPGGWSFGDDIAGGRVLSNKLKSTFRQQFEAFVASGKPMLGVCNGFQVLVKLGALPNLSGAFAQESTLTFNKSGRFEDRWVYLKPQKSACRYFEGVPFINCPVRHGEGQFVPRDRKMLEALSKAGMVPIKYCDEKLDDSAGYPANPNGSAENIAGVCDKTGKILGLMPHPECSVARTTFPRFTAGISSERNSLRFFQNIVAEAAKHI
ncbi:MAG: phosphoribosylformylglycinamidine synthase subunit PurQ [Candidatus Micrarchaeia archaeon]|jgi:phosphoribosylformylglycinamidine synthase